MPGLFAYVRARAFLLYSRALLLRIVSASAAVASAAALLRLLFAPSFAPAAVAAALTASAVIVRLYQAQAVAPSAAAAPRVCSASSQMIGTGGDASGLPWCFRSGLYLLRLHAEALQRVCVVFVFIFTKISIISAILYPKTYKMYVISHFLRKIFGSIKKMYYLCSAFEKIKCPTEGGTLAKSLIKAKL